jgi:hypothetical protein
VHKLYPKVTLAKDSTVYGFEQILLILTYAGVIEIMLVM